MGRRRSGRDVHGILLLDKPPGISSNRAVQRVRHLLQARKAGHTGTLDPFATGMLPVCLGEATKTAGFMLETDKAYRAVAKLGQATDTGDVEGEIVRQQPVPELELAAIERVFGNFTGAISQVPPMYSAVKHQGKRLYELARQGLTVERKSREVVIHKLTFISLQSSLLTFEVECSKGTYIRTLAEDMSAALGTCGHLLGLRRLWVGSFHGQAMVGLEEFEKCIESQSGEKVLLPMDAGLAHWPEVSLDAEAADRFTHGNPVAANCLPGMVRVFGWDGKILGLGEVHADQRLKPNRVFVLAAPEHPDT